MTCTGKEKSEILVYLGRCAYGRARISTHHFLLNGNCRWKALDEIALRLAHTSKELTSV